MPCLGRKGEGERREGGGAGKTGEEGGREEGTGEGGREGGREGGGRGGGRGGGGPPRPSRPARLAAQLCGDGPQRRPDGHLDAEAALLVDVQVHPSARVAVVPGPGAVVAVVVGAPSVGVVVAGLAAAARAAVARSFLRFARAVLVTGYLGGGGALGLSGRRSRVVDGRRDGRLAGLVSAAAEGRRTAASRRDHGEGAVFGGVFSTQRSDGRAADLARAVRARAEELDRRAR